MYVVMADYFVLYSNSEFTVKIRVKKRGCFTCFYSFAFLNNCQWQEGVKAARGQRGRQGRGVRRQRAWCLGGVQIFPGTRVTKADT